MIIPCEAAPEFTCPALFPNKEFGDISLSDYKSKGKWLVLFYYPLDFTFVCPTEIIAYGDRIAEFNSVGCEVLAASCDNKHTHLAWVNTPRSNGGLGDMKIPILADFDKDVANAYGVILKSGGDKGIPCRALYIIDPTGTVRHLTMNDPPVGRNVDETLRLVKAYQYTDEHGEVCPANWTPGSATMVDDPVKSKEYFKTVPDTANGSSGPGGIADVNSIDTFKSVIGSSGITVVDYWAPWCKNCSMLLPSVKELALSNPDVKFIKVNVEENDDSAQIQEMQDIGTLPTFQFFKDGKKLGEWSGNKAAALKKAFAAYK